MSVTRPSILVPVDASPLSEKALPHAIRLARALGLPVRLFTVVDNIVANALTEFADTEAIDPNRAVDAYFERLIRPLAERGIDASFDSKPGLRAAEGLLDYIETNDIDVVVMASHGYSGITRWLLGSIAEKVVRSSRVPVLIVPVREDEIRR